MKSAKCILDSCNRIVGPRRLVKSTLCYTCERNIDAWVDRDRDRRLEWHRRVRMFSERLQRVDNMPTVSKVRQHVKRVFQRRLKEEARG